MSGAKHASLFSRYNIAKVSAAAEEALYQFFSSTPVAEKQVAGSSDGFTRAFSVFKEFYDKQVTSVICMAGPAMAPTLNPKALQHKKALEKLVMRHIPRPSLRTVLIGDVVAFKSPVMSAAPASVQPVMIRRVAALENQEMVSEDPEDVPFQIPKGHCWVLADNTCPDILDSRSFGHFPMSNIIGRIIYRASSPQDHEAVTNHPTSTRNDMPFVEQEVDIAQLYPIAGAKDS
jgi:hypothetical protein